MSAFYCNLFVLLLFSSVGSASNLPVVSAQNFSSLLKDHATLLIHFHAPGCARCAEVSAMLQTASLMLQSDDQSLSIAECDVTAPVNLDMLQQHNIIGYPSLKLYHPLSHRDQALLPSYTVRNFHNLLSAEHIAEHLRVISAAKVADTPSLEISTMHQLNQLLKQAVVVIGVFPSKDRDAEPFMEFTAAVLKMHDSGFIWVHTFDATLTLTLQEGQCCTDQVFVINGSDPTYKTCPTLDKAGLLQCVKESMQSSVVELTGEVHSQQQVQRLLSEHGMVLLALLKNEDYLQSLLRSTLEALAVNAPPLRVIIVNASRHGRLLRNWNIHSAQLPAMILYSTEQLASAVGTNMEASSLEDWVNQQVAARMIQSQGSCPALEEALELGGPFLLHVYVPWSRECLTAKEELIRWTAEALEKDAKSSWKVVDIDASKCGLPPTLQLTQYPALFFIHTQSCESVRFTADFSAEAVGLFWQQAAVGLPGAIYTEAITPGLPPVGCNSTLLTVVEPTTET